MDRGLIFTVLVVTLSWGFLGTYGQTSADGITAEPLDANITSEGCGNEYLCAAEPFDCMPSAAGSCLFLAVKNESNQYLSFRLSGDSNGYIAATLSNDTKLGNNDTTYVCANNNGTVQFFTARHGANMLTKTMLNVTSVNGKVTGRRIQCDFKTKQPDPSTTHFSLAICIGPFNSTSGMLGSPMAQLLTSVVSITNVTANVTNILKATVTNSTMKNSTMTNLTMTTPTMKNSTMKNSTMTTPTMKNSTMTTPTMKNSTMTTPTMKNSTMTTPTMTNSTVTTPTVTNTTVELLQTLLTREGCSTAQLCIAEPANCSPNVSGSCYFVSVKQQNDEGFQFGVSGESGGYIAITLSTDTTLGGNDTTYICANNNSVVQFFTAFLDNNTLIVTQLDVNSVMGRVNGSTIQCTFVALLSNTRSKATTAPDVSVTISNGTFNATSGEFGTPSIRISTGILNLANVTANVNDTSNSTTTTAHAVTLHHSLMQSLLVTVAVLGLAML